MNVGYILFSQSDVIAPYRNILLTWISIDFYLFCQKEIIFSPQRKIALGSNCSLFCFFFPSSPSCPHLCVNPKHQRENTVLLHRACGRGELMAIAWMEWKRWEQVGCWPQIHKLGKPCYWNQIDWTSQALLLIIPCPGACKAMPTASRATARVPVPSPGQVCSSTRRVCHQASCRFGLCRS